MADRPNNFGEVLLKAIGSTAEEAPSIFNNARTRKKAESLQMLNAMMQFQDAQREDQQLKMQQAQQQQQAQVAKANMAHIQAETAKIQYEMSQPYRDWVDEQARKADERKRLLDRQQLEDQLKLYQRYNMTKTGNTPSGGAGSGQLLTPDDLVKRTQGKQSTLLGRYQGEIDNAMSGAPEEQARATYIPKINEILSAEWFAANMAHPAESLGFPKELVGNSAKIGDGGTTTTTTQTQPQPTMTRAILEDAVKNNKLKKTDPQYIKWDKYFKARNQ